MDFEAQKKRDARKALINIAMVDGFLVVAVVAVYLYTNNLVYLIGGLVGTALISGPMILRWYNEYASVLKASQSNGDRPGEDV